MELFGTAGIRGDARERITPALALAVGRAAGEDGDEFVLARDGRETGRALAAALEAGLLGAGATVRRAGVLPTPALAFASRGRRGAMVTASHNPPPDNGIKLFADGREYDRAAERAVEDRVELVEGHPVGPGPVAWDRWGETTDLDVLGEYREAVAAYVRGLNAVPDGSGPVADAAPPEDAEADSDAGAEADADTDADADTAPLDGTVVALDCGTGVAGLATPAVLRALGADVLAVNANVDGHFPARESKPTAESTADFRAFVADRADDPEAAAVDVGFAHDGDADRVVAVDGGGEVVHEDTVVAILAERYVRESGAADPVVVTTPNASARIDERVRAAGGRVERVRLGALHEGVADARAAGDEGTEVVFAAEPWKHVHTGFGGWIDGVASAAVLAGLVAAEGLDALRAPVAERPYRKESVACPDDRKGAAMARLAETLPAAFPEAAVSTEYGVRLERPDGSWVLVRPSGTEPYVRVYAESEAVDALIERAVGVVEEAVGNGGGDGDEDGNER